MHTVAPELDLFDTQGSLQQQSALVSQVLEVISDLEDEDVDPAGSVLLEAPDRKGFRGFERPPFGWSSELVRLVLAACFRAGAIYVERPTPAGPTPLYDYKDSYDLFSKINTFKHVMFRVAETSLSVDQIKRANKELIAMGVTGTPESGNAIAAAVRKLGETLKAGIQEAKGTRGSRASDPRFRLGRQPERSRNRPRQKTQRRLSPLSCRTPKSGSL